MIAEAVDEDKLRKKANAEIKLAKSPACTVNPKDIVVKLHETALKYIGDKYNDYAVQNTAIDGEKGNYQFYGAGQHIIAAVPDGKNAKTISRNTAFEILKIYVNWFSGPDMAKKLTPDILKPLEAENAPKKNKEEDKTQKLQPKKEEASVSESNLIPDFLKYLTEANEDSESSEEDSEEKDNSKGSEDTSDDKKSEDEEIGYYISYVLEFDGQKTSNIKSSIGKLIKGLSKTLLAPLGITLGNWMTGAKGDAHTLGGLKNAFDKHFGGSFDKEEIESNFRAELSKTFTDSDPLVKVIDGKTILSYLGKQIQGGKDTSMIKEAKYSLCTRISKKDKSYSLYSKRIIAEVLTSSIKGLFKSRKLLSLGILPRFTKSNVVYVNNYSENKKTKGEIKYIDNNDGEVADSLKRNFAGHLIAEAEEGDDSVEKTRKRIEDLLEKTAKSKLADKYVSSQYDESEKIVSLLKEKAAAGSKTISNLNKSKYSYLVQTQFEAEEKDRESIEKKLVSDVKDVLIEVIYAQVKDRKDKKSPSEKPLQALAPISASAEPKSVSESIKRDANSLMKLLFEDLVTEAMSEADVIASIDKQLRSSLTDTIKSQVDTKLSVNPKAGFASSENALDYLQKYGLLDNNAKDKISKSKYAFYFVIKKKKEEKDSEGVTQTYGGSPGNPIFLKNENLAKSAFSAFDNAKLDNFFSYDMTANNKLTYNKTKIPADCRVFIGTVSEDLEKKSVKQTVTQYWAVPDDNDFATESLKFDVGVIFLKDKDKPDSYEVIGDIVPIDEFDFPSISSIPKRDNGSKPVKFDIATKKDLLKLSHDIENGDKDAQAKHVFTDSETGKKFLAVKVQYEEDNESNDTDKKVIENRTEYDFYIVPIKGMDFKSNDDNQKK